eukprot:SAG11_NODE_3961_length_2132_cov_1.162814_3_plen_124_part_00
MGYELMLVEAVDHSPDYDVTVVAKNKQDEAQDIEQDKQEKAINKDLGKASKENVIEKTLRDIEQELEEGEYEVEKILKRRKRNNRFEYLLKYKGYPDSENTWEPRSNIKVDLYKGFDRTLDTK